MRSHCLGEPGDTAQERRRYHQPARHLVAEQPGREARSIHRVNAVAIVQQSHHALRHRATAPLLCDCQAGRRPDHASGRCSHRDETAMMRQQDGGEVAGRVRRDDAEEFLPHGIQAATGTDDPADTCLRRGRATPSSYDQCAASTRGGRRASSLDAKARPGSDDAYRRIDAGSATMMAAAPGAGPRRGIHEDRVTITCRRGCLDSGLAGARFRRAVHHGTGILVRESDRVGRVARRIRRNDDLRHSGPLLGQQCRNCSFELCGFVMTRDDHADVLRSTSGALARKGRGSPARCENQHRRVKRKAT